MKILSYVFVILFSLNEKLNGWDVFWVFFCFRVFVFENEESGLNYNVDMVYISMCLYMFIIILVDEKIER